MPTLRVFASIQDARAAGFSGPLLRDPDRPDVIAWVDGMDPQRLAGLRVSNVVVEPGASFDPRRAAS